MRTKDIGELYRDAFRTYTPTPPSGVWNGVARSLSGKTGGGVAASWVKPLLWTAVAGGLITLAVLLSVPPAEDEDLAPALTTLEPASAEAQDSLSPEVALEASGQTEEVIPSAVPEKRNTAALVREEKTSSAVSTTSPTVATAGGEAVVSPPVPAKSAGTASPAEGKPSAMDRHRLQRTSSSSSAATAIRYSKESTICKGQQLMIGASGGTAYQWSNGSTTDSILISPELTTIYRVTVTRTDQRKVSGEVRVNVHDCSSLFVPNAFTPNADGHNDEFMAYGTGITAFRMVIQSLSGTLLFETSDMAVGWDGTYLGEPAETGAYLYRIDYIDEYGNPGSRNGRLTLLR
ncbi:MAG TPA: gliding motility-associated C-terminal domain-containing protein [Bacteroidales bacterium]|nr:gliding motility-associated C-terminal domain-containing protein [Bacteroidales bacterium]HRZ76639.1 gliding motility-associated C-terminal domain-containing protein [Bacteroidales bacterium]